MKAASPDAVLAGNGVIAADTEPSAAFRGNLEPLEARAYTNAALAGRTVVRLVQSRVTASEDATLAVLGFTAGASPVVGQAKRRAIGFPAAAIAKAPALARYALEITKDFQRESRRIKSKPGHALQGFGKLADELGRSVPAFLPSFWEEAGRAFLAAGNLVQAGQCFGKARAAEDVHHLEVAEAERHEAFLEFALAGGLSIGVLTGYAKTLERRFPPAEAYQRFRALCRERVLGGQPPWSGMANELARLAKAAKHDVAAEEARLLGEILGSPAVAKAPQGFWQGYKKTLVRMCQAEPSWCARLLDLRLKPNQAKDDFPDFWLELLDATGATDALVSGAPAAAQPSGASAAFDALVALGEIGYSGFPPTGLVDLLERLAPRLVREGAPIRLFFGHWRLSWDLDALERALGLGVPVLEGPAKASAAGDDDDEGAVYFDLSAWSEHADAPGRGLDPVHVAAHPKLAEAFSEAVGVELSDAAFQAASAGKSGFIAGKRAYFQRLSRAAASGGLVAVAALLDGLTKVARQGTFDDLPEVHAELAALDFIPALGRTVRGGLPDELVWPAWEAALAKLGPKAAVLGPFPHVIVGDKRRVMVLGRDEAVFTHDVRLPKGATIVGARWVGGDLCVRFEKDYDGYHYWASAPTRHVPIDGGSWNAANAAGVGFDLPDGAWSEGGKAIVRGDTTWPDAAQAYFDGQTLWDIGWVADERVARELDWKTGAHGRTSLPAFFAAQADPGRTVDLGSSTLYPVPDGAGSPLGVKDGLAGWCVTSGDGRGVAAVGVDGREKTGDLASGHPSSGMLTFPGHTSLLPVGYSSRYSGAMIRLDDPSGAFTLAAIVLQDEDDDEVELYPWCSRALARMPWHTWHYLRPRDAAASAALRAVPDDVLAVLVAGHTPSEKVAVTEAAVREALPAVKDAVLVAALATRVRQTVALQAQLQDLLASATPSGAGAVLNLGRRALADALHSFTNDFGWGQDAIAPELRVLARAIAEPAAFAPSSQACEPLFMLLGQEALLVALAASPAYAEHREVLLDLFVGLSAIELPDAARVRMRTVTGEALVALIPPSRVVARGQAVYYIPSYDEDEDEAQLYEVALDGAFPTLPKVATKADAGGSWTSARGPRWGDDAAALVRERGATPWDPQIAEVLAQRTGLSTGEAALLWLGLPGLLSYEKNFLPKEVRELVGLKVAQAQVARDSLKRRLAHEHDRVTLLVAALPDTPAELYAPLGAGSDDRQSPIARLAAAWCARFGKQQQVDDGLLERTKKDLGGLRQQPGVALALFHDPAQSPALQVDKRWLFKGYGDLGSDESGPGFDADTLTSALGYAAWLFHELPVGHPTRAGIPAVLDAVRARVLAPGFLVPWGQLEIDSGTDWRKQAEAAFDALGGTPFSVEEAKARGADLGPVKAYWSGYARIDLALVPARFGDAHAAEVVASLAGRVQTWGGDPLVVVQAALSEGPSALAARVAETPVPEGGFETNPLLSAPQLVKDVAAKLGVTPEAASYYLQLLVLPYAADQRVLAINEASGWTGRVLAAAAAELVDNELAVTGKRARAGREVFLPGGWVDLKAPYPPMELWKLGFHGLAKVDGEGFSTAWAQVLMTEPAHVLFERAWARVAAGDGPRFEEAGAERKQKKSRRGAK